MTSRRRALVAHGLARAACSARARSPGAQRSSPCASGRRRYTRVTIGPTPPSARATSSPPRPNGSSSTSTASSWPGLRELVGEVRADDPYIAGVRVGQNQPRVVRLVLDLKQAVAPELFALAPVAAYQHRLVFDLHPAQERDPLLRADPRQGAGRAEGRAGGSGRARRVHRRVGAAGGAASAPARRSRAARSRLRCPAPPAPLAASAPPGARVPAPLPESDAIPRPRCRRSSRRRRSIASSSSRSTRRHGGEDPGAIGPSGLREKDVVLAVALLLRDRINANPGMRAMLTHDADFFVPLHERVEKGTPRAGRSLRLDSRRCVHQPGCARRSCRAQPAPAPTSSAARWMANRENASDLVGGTNLHAKDETVLRTLLDMTRRRRSRTA